MLEQRPPREDEAVLEEVGEVGGVLHVVGEANEVPADLPPDGLAQQLLAAARETGGRSSPARRPTP